MKSKLIKVKDYREIEIPSELTIMGVQALVDADVRHLLRPYKSKVQADEIALSDVVTLDLKSEDARFNRSNLPLNVGSGLFDEALEQAIVGLKRETTTTISVEGVAVEVTVKNIQRTVFPELTDEHVQAWAKSEEGEENVTDVQSFLKYSHDKHYQEMVDAELFQQGLLLMEGVYEQSEWIIDETEQQDLTDKVLADMTEELQELGKTWETLEPEDYQNYWQVDNYEAVVDSIKAMALEYIVQQLLACHYANKDAKDVKPDDVPPMDIYQLFKDYVTTKMVVKED